MTSNGASYVISILYTRQQALRYDILVQERFDGPNEDIVIDKENLRAVEETIQWLKKVENEH